MEFKKNKEIKKEPAPQELSLTGTIIRRQVVKKRKDGSEQTVTIYYLAADKETIQLPQPRQRQGDATGTGASDLADFVNTRVRVKALGWRYTKRGGSHTVVKEVIKVEPLE